MNEPKFNLNGFTLDEIKNSGFNIVAAVWIEDNPDADEEKKSKFVKKFFHAYRNRPSLKKGSPSKTIPDPLVAEIVAIRIENNKYNNKEITKLHRVAMASENLIGALLEEYIANNVIDKGWANCWGSTILATDFVSVRSLLEEKGYK